ncbi:mucin-binding protein [Lactiplantibacillus pentosus]|uniref:mucin-binding protein n=1 Tax=Lactiplantibacillus pentosus TaxID=1589 RepID=UPI0021A2C5ED|nr:MBG domain-containing protein [Lactiplantibacillus pentosus]
MRNAQWMPYKLVTDQNFSQVDTTGDTPTVNVQVISPVSILFSIRSQGGADSVQSVLGWGDQKGFATDTGTSGIEYQAFVTVTDADGTQHQAIYFSQYGGSFNIWGYEGETFQLDKLQFVYAYIDSTDETPNANHVVGAVDVDNPDLSFRSVSGKSIKVGTNQDLTKLAVDGSLTGTFLLDYDYFNNNGTIMSLVQTAKDLNGDGLITLSDYTGGTKLTMNDAPVKAFYAQTSNAYLPQVYLNVTGPQVLFFRLNLSDGSSIDSDTNTGDYPTLSGTSKTYPSFQSLWGVAGSTTDIDKLITQYEQALKTKYPDSTFTLSPESQALVDSLTTFPTGTSYAASQLNNLYFVANTVNLTANFVDASDNQIVAASVTDSDGTSTTSTNPFQVISTDGTTGAVRSEATATDADDDALVNYDTTTDDNTNLLSLLAASGVAIPAGYELAKGASFEYSLGSNGVLQIKLTRVADGGTDVTKVTIENQQLTYGQTVPETYTVTVGDDLTTDGITWSADDFQVIDGTTGTVMTSGLQAGGDYQIQLTATGREKLEQANPDYDFKDSAFSDGTLTVVKLAVTVTASDVTKAFGQSDPALTLKDATGVLVNGDSLDALGVTLRRKTGEKVGRYDITGTSTSSNYDVTVEPGVFQITNTAPVIDASDVTVPYATTDDLLTLIQATATDAEDGDLTSQIKIADDGNFDATVVGSYRVTLQVTDQADETTQKVVTVTVAEPTSVSAILTFVDQTTGQVVDTQTLSGKPGTTPTTKVPVPTNYTVVSGTGFVDNGDGTITDTQPLTLDDSDDLTVYLQHATSVTEPPTNVDDAHYAATHKTYTVAVTATAPNDEPSLDVTPTGTTTQTLTYTRTMTMDDVTGEVLSYGDWTTADDYTTVTAKVIAGYSTTDDLTASGSAQPLSITAADVKDQLTAFAANPDTDNDQAEFKITYQATNYTIKFIDVDNNNAVVGELTGNAADDDSVAGIVLTESDLAVLNYPGADQLEVAQDNQYLSSDGASSWQGAFEKVAVAAGQTVTVELKHKQATDDFTTSRIISYLYPDGSSVARDDEQDINWTATTDLWKQAVTPTASDVTVLTTYDEGYGQATAPSDPLAHYAPTQTSVAAETSAAVLTGIVYGDTATYTTNVKVNYVQTVFAPDQYLGDNDYTDYQALTKTISVVRNYGEPVGSSQQTAAPITLYRTATYDLSKDASDASAYSYSVWTTNSDGISTSSADQQVSDAAMDEKTPAGYTATTTNMANGIAIAGGAGVITVSGAIGGDDDIQVVRDVTYTADPATLTVTYVDDDDQQSIVTTDELTGVTDASGDYETMGKFDSTKYELATGQAATVNYQFAADPDTSDNLTIHLAHKHTSALPDGFNGQTTQTVIYTGAGKSTPTMPQPQVIEWTTDTDLVTGQVTYMPVNQTTAVITPTVPDYTPDKLSVPVSSFTSTTTMPVDTIITVTYQQTTFTPENPGTVDGTQSEYLTHTVTYDVHYATGSTATDPETVTETFYRQAVIAAEGDTVTYTAWTTDSTGNPTKGQATREIAALTELGTPAGYTAVVKTTTTAANADGSLGQSSFSENEPVTIDGQVVSVLREVSYLANSAALTITYVDDDRQGEQVGTPIQLTGVTDATGRYTVTVPANYVLADGQSETIDYTFAPNQTDDEGNVVENTSDNVVVHLQHAHSTELPAGFTGTTTDTVTYVGLPTAKNPGNQQQTVTWTTSTDLVTGVTTYTPTNQTDAVRTPLVAGYTADTTVVPASDYVATTTAPTDQLTQVTYSANAATLQVTYVDVDNGNSLVGTPTTLTGQTDATGHYDASAHFDQTKYELADGQAATVPYTFAAGTATSDDLVIKLQHKRVTTLPDDFTGTTTETVHYVGAGSATPADYSQNITWTTSTDLVTGVTTYTPTNQAAAVKTPVITGYRTDTAEVVATNYLSTTVQPTNQVTTVTYIVNVEMMTPPTDPTNSHYADTHKQFTETVQAVVPSGVAADLTPDNSSQTLNYARAYQVDAATGVVTGNYGAWTLESSDFTTVTAKTLPGYQTVPATVSATNFAAELQAFINDTSVTDATHVDYIQYVANTDTAATIQYVDTTTNTPVQLETVIGTTNQTADYTVSVPQGYEIDTAKTTMVDGEQLSIKLTADDTDNLTIYLKHATQTVLPTDPTYAAETNAEVVRVINYQYRDGTQAANRYSDNLFFTRTVTVDQVTNQIVAYGDWVPTTTATFAAKDSPVIPGYTATLATVPAKTVVATDQQVVFTVTYQANPDTAATINYLDVETGQNVQTATIQGETDTTSDYLVKVPAGYVLADTQPATIHNGEVSVIFKADDSDDVTIYLTHDSVTIEPNDPETKPNDPIPGDSGKTYGDYTTATTVTVTRTINYLYGDTATKAADSRVQTVNFARSITVDQVTGEILSTGDWTVVSEKSDFSAVASPTIAGYTATPEVVAASTPTGDTPDETLNVRYTANHDTTATISYVDEKTGQTVKSDQPVGTTDTTVNYQVDVPNGYVIDTSRSNYQNGQQLSIVLKGTNADNVTIYLTHDSLTIDPNDPETKPNDPIPGDSGKTYGDYTKATTATVTRTINYLYGNTANKAADSKVQTVSFTRSITVDQVTGEILSTGDWRVVSEKSDFAAVTSPTIAGYTADKRTVSAGSPTSDTPDESLSVRYTANHDTTATVSYVDEQTGEVVKSDQPVGTTDTTVNYQVDVPAGYVIDTSRSNYQNGQQLSIVLKGTNADDVTIYLTHDSLTIDPNDPETKPDAPIPGGSGKTYGDYTKATNATVTRTINYLYGDTANKAADSKVQTVSFTRSITVDQVTGEILSTGDWTVVGKTTNFAAVASPTIAGYTADKRTVSAVTPTAGSQSITTTVTYSPNTATPATISYQDRQTGNVVTTVTLTGTTNTSRDYQLSVPAGYVLAEHQVANITAGKVKLTFTPDERDNVTVYLTHQLEELTPELVHTRTDDPIPGGSGKTYGDYLKATQSVATRTIKYVDGQTGQPIAKPVVQSLQFERTIQIDDVTGAITVYGQWQPTTTNSFAAIQSPSIGGYTTQLLQVPVAQAVPGQQTQATVHYTVAPHSFTVTPTDTTGQPLPGVPAIQLTGVTGELVQVPQIPGYEFVGITPHVPASGGIKLVYVKVQTQTPASTGDQTTTTTADNVRESSKTIGQHHDTTPVVTGQLGQHDDAKSAAGNQLDLAHDVKQASSKRNASGTAKSGTNRKVSTTRLPQTGESTSQALSLTGMLALVLSFLGLAGVKKRKHKQD